MRLLLVIIVVFSVVFGSYSQQTGNEAESDKQELIYRGKKINEKGAITISEMVVQMGEKKKFKTKVIAEVVSCCQKKGCWMQVNLGNEELMRVRFKDYGFFVPFDSPGRLVIMEGEAFYDEVSVDMLRHYAEDAEKSKEEIEAITEPEYKLAFEATGLILK